MPAAEFEVSPDLVRRLLASQHPDLSGLPVEVMANGWDNLICRLGEDLLVRLPSPRCAPWRTRRYCADSIHRHAPFGTWASG